MAEIHDANGNYVGYVTSSGQIVDTRRGGLGGATQMAVQSWHSVTSLSALVFNRNAGTDDNGYAKSNRSNSFGLF